MVSAVPVVSVISFLWFRFGVSGFSTCPFREIDLCGLLDRFRRTVDRVCSKLVPTKTVGLKIQDFGVYAM